MKPHLEMLEDRCIPTVNAVGDWQVIPIHAESWQAGGLVLYSLEADLSISILLHTLNPQMGLSYPPRHTAYELYLQPQVWSALEGGMPPVTISRDMLPVFGLGQLPVIFAPDTITDFPRWELSCFYYGWWYEDPPSDTTVFPGPQFGQEPRAPDFWAGVVDALSGDPLWYA